MKRRDFGLLILLLLFTLHIPFSSGKLDGQCISKGGRFPPFSTEGKPPKKVSKGSKDLTLCRVFRQKTCCDVAQTHPALLSIRRLASTGEVVAPCGVNDFVCGKASQWVSNGTELCLSAGFTVKSYEAAEGGTEEASCYGGRASLDSIAESWRPSHSELPQEAGNSWNLKYFQQRIQEISYSEKVSWAVGGMVLTAGLLFLSKRKSYSQRQRLAAIQRTARKLEGKMNNKYSDIQGNRKGNRR